MHNIEFTVADVHQLPFDDDSFDIVHALTEMRRVCRPDGLVAVRDSDYAAFTWYPVSPDLDDWLRLYSEAARANQGEPDAGRMLLAWAHAAGFREVVPGSSTWCLATPEDRAWWGGMWAGWLSLLHGEIIARP